MLYLGLDLGTQGVRVVIVDENGTLAAATSLPLHSQALDQQDPADWWLTCCQAIARALAELPPPHTPAEIAALAVDSTSGTILPIDRYGQPTGAPFMYCNTAAQAEAETVCTAAGDWIKKLGYRFTAAFGLPKILWLKNNKPGQFNAAHKMVHPTDFINGKLTDQYGITDDTNALKTGYDLIDGGWPAFIEEQLGIPLGKLPQVVAPGAPLGSITAEAAQQTGLPKGTPVVAGMSDGTASFVSSGAMNEGEFNATLGTTLVIKGTVRQRIASPSGALYCARHPRGEGWWLPGGGSFAGGAYLTKQFPPDQLDPLQIKAAKLLPTGLSLYPIVAPGERFPCIAPTAKSFVEPKPSSKAQHLAAAMEGVGYVERWIYEMIEELGAPVGHDIYTSGGGCKSDLWLQIRADITGRRMHVPAIPEAAMGSAILAASTRCDNGDIATACARMVRIKKIVEPRPDMTERYHESYATFRTTCRQHGFA